MKIKIDSLDNIHAAAKEFLQNMGDGKVFAFYLSLIHISEPTRPY